MGLNTPGVPDGTFTLDVNGTRIMEVHGIFYREAPITTPLRMRRSRRILHRHNLFPLAIGEVTASQVPDMELAAAGENNSNPGMGSLLNSFLMEAGTNAAGIAEMVGTEGGPGDEEETDPLEILEEPLQNDDGEFDYVKSESPVVANAEPAKLVSNDPNVATVTAQRVATVFLPALLPDQTHTVYANRGQIDSADTETTLVTAVGFVGIFFR